MRPRIKGVPVCSVTGTKSRNLQSDKERRYCRFMGQANKCAITAKGKAYVLCFGEKVYLKRYTDIEYCQQGGIKVYYE